VLTYASRLRSYRELPIRWAELGTVYRYERPGVMHGLMRVRGFTQDDAHIFCLPDQIGDEILGVLNLTSRSSPPSISTPTRSTSPPAQKNQLARTASGSWPPGGLIDALERKGWAGGEVDLVGVEIEGGEDLLGEV